MENGAFESPALTTSGNDDVFRLAVMAECWPGGPIVSNPADCRDWDRSAQDKALGLPDLEITL